jgi:hypothetical protein
MGSDGFIAVTTVFPPTEGVMKFSSLPGYQTIVAGDEKTPADWQCSNVVYISLKEQAKMNYGIVKLLPVNHYCRKMIAYICAIKQGAQILIDTDDDNIPKSNWKTLRSEGKYLTTKRNLGFVNIYKSYTKQHIWPRGFPLTRIVDMSSVLSHSELEQKKVRVGVWQGLVDGDPDVDAIYRLTDNSPCYFEQKAPVILDKGTVCPFNSQNTEFCVKELFPLLFLPAFVNFRFTDILRGLIAQPIMWAKDYLLGFCQSTVIQKRNPHNYLKDFENEIPCYLYPEQVIDVVSDIVQTGASISDNLYSAYEALEKKGITIKQEVNLLYEWLKDVA